jgi:hypothetical protein
VKSPQSIPKQKKSGLVSWTIAFAGALLGLFLSFGVLSGDELGRVNLLYLLVLFVLVPLLSVAVSTLSMIRGRGLNLARLIAHLPLLSVQQKQALHRLQQQKLDKYWLYLQSQYAAIAYATGSLLGLLFLLLFTDINFVWRSTLLAPEDLLQPLKIIAAPWWYWSAAQPSLELLQATRDSRLVTAGREAGIFTQWWPFILATQLFYAFVLRFIGLMIGKVVLRRKLSVDIEQQLSRKINAFQPVFAETSETRPPSTVLPARYVVTNWDGFNQQQLNMISRHLDLAELLVAGPLASEQQHLRAASEKRPQVLLVKAWEPPLGELGDYLEQTSGMLMPINIVDGKLVTPARHHLAEWLRFAERFAHWQVYMPASLL